MSVPRLSLLAAMTALLAAGCAAPAGDFGRPRPNYFNGELMPSIGKIAATHRREARSDLSLTDDERELRERSWAIVMPNWPRSDFERAVTELRRTRIIPARWTRVDHVSYAISLSKEKFASSSARYHRLRDDIEKDRALMPGFFATAQRVMAADTARERALQQVPAVAPREREDAMARVAENRMVIWWSHEALKERARSYTYALERLMIETPERASIDAERALIAFQRDIAAIGPFGPAEPARLIVSK